MHPPSAEVTRPRLPQLLGFLDQDPENLNLLSDAAAAAFDEGEPSRAGEFLERYSQLGPLPPHLLNLRGLVALDSGRFADAAADFSTVIDQGDSNPAVRFNLAWALTMTGEYDRALELMDEETSVVGGRAAGLKVQLLHHAERLEEALEFGANAAERFPYETLLMGALASVALDAEQPELAQAYAEKAGSNPDGLSTLGLLLLDDDKVEQSLELFEHALERQATNPRALLGKGLALLRNGQNEAGAERLDAAARTFGDHLGSWVAAGWAYFVLGDLQTSRSRFEKALELDDTFAETHGALAVIDIADGQIESARRRTRVAMQLDRQCFSAVLAQSLLMERDGDAEGARRIREIAMTTPIGPNGRTIALALARAGLKQKHQAERRPR